MSLFDIIKYPISDTPTKEQLDALPDEIYQKWVVMYFSKQIPRKSMAMFYKISKNNPRKAGHIKGLRELIKEF